MSKTNNDIFIPIRFERAITLHILKNKILDKHPSIHPPLILGIDGFPGTGKTFLCQKVIEKLGYKEILISGGELESKNAGEPAELIRERYLQANRILATKRYNGVVLLFNDIETGIGDWGGGTQYTVNRQTVFGELMHIVDYPNSVGGVETARIPIIMTGNDFSKLYEPLTRAGRFESFTWIPTIDETIAIASHILNFLDKSMLKRLILSLVHNYKKEGFEIIPISFFSHFKSLLINDALWNLYLKHPDILENKDIKLDFDKYFSTKQFSYEELLQQGWELLNNHYFEAHLRGLELENKDKKENKALTIDKNINLDCKKVI